MTADDLKITVLRAAKPGDVVFFNVTSDDNEHRSLMMALRDYLAPTGIIPVMLPHSIQLAGSIFEKPESAVVQAKICRYTQAELGGSLWLSDCGHEFYLSSGLELLDYCGHCGGQVEEIDAEQVATPGATTVGEDSVRNESSRPQELRCFSPDEIEQLRVRASASKQPFHTDLAPALKEAIGKIELRKAEIAKLRDELREARLETARACTDALRTIGMMAAENEALRNLAENLRPGPISEALGGVEHEQPYRKTAEQLLGIPILIVEDPTSPPDQIELHSPNGQVVRVVNLGVPRESP
jgi:hypothetical protein